jgi:hypothetical protein
LSSFAAVVGAGERRVGVAADGGRLFHPSPPRLAIPPDVLKDPADTIGPELAVDFVGGRRSANMAELEGGEKDDMGEDVESAVGAGWKASPNEADKPPLLAVNASPNPSPNPVECSLDGADLPVGQADPPPLALPPIGSHSRPELVTPVLTILLSSVASTGAPNPATAVPFAGRPLRIGEIVSTRLGRVGPVGTGPELRMLE